MLKDKTIKMAFLSFYHPEKTLVLGKVAQMIHDTFL